MTEVLDSIVKAIKDNTYTYKDTFLDCEQEFDYVDGPCLTRDVLLIFQEYEYKKLEKIKLKLTELKAKEDK